MKVIIITHMISETFFLCLARNFLLTIPLQACNINLACPVKSGELLALVNKSFYYIQLELTGKLTANW